ARLLDRLAAVQRLEHRELARALLENARDPEQVLRPVGAGQLAPAILERVPRRGDGCIDILGASLRDFGERFLARRRDRRVPVAGARLDELAADEDPVALVEPRNVARL